MESLSPEIEEEIERRLVQGNYSSIDDLFRDALKALDDAKANALALLEKELLLGLEGEDVEMTESDWDSIEQEALQLLESRKQQ